MKNCINCGAPLESEVNKCPYCNTSYFDISAVDLSSHSPIYLKLKMNGRIITALVEVEPNTSITYSCDYVDVFDNGHQLTKLYLNSSAEINLTLRCVPDDNNRLYTVKTE